MKSRTMRYGMSQRKVTDLYVCASYSCLSRFLQVFNYSVSTANIMFQIRIMIEDGGNAKICKLIFMDYFYVLSQHPPGEGEYNHATCSVRRVDSLDMSRI